LAGLSALATNLLFRDAEAREVEQLKEAMRVRPHPARQRRPPRIRRHYPGITVELGDPGD